MGTKHALVVVALCALCLVSLPSECQESRNQRQQASTAASEPKRVGPLGAVSLSSSSALASASSSSSSNSIDRRPVAGQTLASNEDDDNEQEASAQAVPSKPANNDVDEPVQSSVRPLKRPGQRKAKRRPTPALVQPAGTGQRRPPARDQLRPSDYDEEEEEECDEYDNPVRNDFGQHMFARPMRQISRMMGDMFDQMQGMTSGDFMPDGANVAMASAYNDQGGDSRLTSLVRRNGRTRGIISESSNGRVKTRRFGGDEDYADE